MTDAQERDTAEPLILRNGEKFYRLSKLARLLPEEPETKTVWEWVRYGRKSFSGDAIVRMEAIMGTVGLCSSVEAYHRFIRRINGARE